MRSSPSTAIRSTRAGGPPSTSPTPPASRSPLTIENADGERRTVAVTPLADETPLRYQAWVADRRAFTRERSGGRLGYLHVPDMMSPGWAQLHRDLRVEMARDGIILDLRDNGGGHTSQLVVEKFAKRIVGWVAQSRLRAGVLPARLAARSAGHGRRRARRVRRRHRHGGDQGPRSRSRRRDADVGRGRRHRREVHVGRRHDGHPAALRVLAGGLRVGRRELRRRSRHRGRALSGGHRQRP